MVNELRRIVGFLDAEIERQIRGGRPTKKQARRITQLRAKFGGCKLDLRKLRALREKQVNLIKIAALKKCHAKDREQVRLQTNAIREKGPSKWASKSKEQRKLTPSQVHELELY